MGIFAVFDGHGGPEAAKYCEKFFEAKLKEAIGTGKRALCVTDGGVWNYLVLGLISAALAVTFLGMICEDKYNTWKDDNE